MVDKTIDDLPEGMLSEILVRLPVKTLLICKAVCKPWLSLISNPHFVKSQLLGAIMASMYTPTLLTIEKPPPTPPTAEQLAFELKAAEMERNFVTYTSPEHELQMQRRRQLIDQALLDTNAQDLSTSPVQFDRLVIPRIFYAHYRVIGVCNGIICLANGFGNDVCLWNPSISKCKKLPAPKPYTATSIPVKVGFGYDPISNDYKVFRVVLKKMSHVVPLVQVYSSNADAWTTEFKTGLLKNCQVYGRTNVVVNGVLYFDAYFDGGSNQLLSFHLHQEIFGLVPFPSVNTSKGSEVLDFQGSVAMVFQSDPEIDLWTLDDVSGDEVSWTKRFSIEADSETEIWLSKYLGAGQFFGRKLFNRSFTMFNVLYDYEKKETKIYKPQEENVFAYLKYTETLVSLDGFEQVQENAN